MRQHLMASGSLLLLLNSAAGCSGSSTSGEGSSASHLTGSSASSATPTPPTIDGIQSPTSATFPTALCSGQTCNSFHVFVVGNGSGDSGTRAFANYDVVVWYVDALKHFSSGQQPFSAWVSSVITDGVGSPQTISPFTLQPDGQTYASQQFSVQVEGQQGNFQHVMVAFQGPDGHWDSNAPNGVGQGQNYDVGLGFNGFN
jgi:hypothetical protein